MVPAAPRVPQRDARAAADEPDSSAEQLLLEKLVSRFSSSSDLAEMVAPVPEISSLSFPLEKFKGTVG